MYHSITFGDKNTWDDWHIVPVSRPVFNPPALKKKTVEIPGADSFIDLTESLTRYPVFENREGSFEFIVMNGYKPWYQAYSDIMNYLHGQGMRAVLEDDREYFYEGRFTVNEWKSEEKYSKIVIDYSVEPYKRLIHTSLEDWEWDPFNFETGVIPDNVFKAIPIKEEITEYVFTREQYGYMPVSPSFIVSTTSGSGAFVRFINEKLGIDESKMLDEGKTQFLRWLFAGETTTVQFYCFYGTGTISIEFREGRL